MTVAAGQCDARRFRTVITRQMGWQFDDSRLGFLGTALQRRLARLEMPTAHYLAALAAGTLPAEPVALAEELTVGETYFFRNHEQFRAVAEVVVPTRMLALGHSGKLAVLSAGCASGEEAYSLAIALHDALPDPVSQVEIRAVDLNEAALSKAAGARYSPWALREVPAAIKRRWFQPAGRELVVSETARALVRFENRNLASGDPELWQAQTFDVVFCRNVIMYFSPDQARILLDRIARSLRPGGYLFLGHAETLRSLSDKFMLRQSHDTFYYQLNDDAPSVISSHPLPGIAFAPLVATAGPTLPGNEWMAAIRDADERIAALAAAKQAAARRAAPVVGRWDLAAAFDLLRDERFAEALALIARLPPAAAADPDVLLLRAAILAMGGQRVAAEETCRQLLAISEGNAGAHHILALCHDAVGETASATEHSRIAVRLDGSFAMPRLHLGLLTRRSGDRDAARRELGRALILLRREEPLRLLMFGGGFGRAGLISLCAAALRDCGGSP